MKPSFSTKVGVSVYRFVPNPSLSESNVTPRLAKVVGNKSYVEIVREFYVAGVTAELTMA